MRFQLPGFERLQNRKQYGSTHPIQDRVFFSTSVSAQQIATSFCYFPVEKSSRIPLVVYRHMGAAASMPAARAAAWETGISHRQRVTRLYRAALRTSRDWVIDYDLWIIEARGIQARFQANKDLSATEGKFLVEKGMAELLEKRHPDPYIPIYAPGSSRYQRNVPPPPELTEKSMPPPHQCIQ